MASFTTRVELHHADEDDYDTLHGAMESEGFTRFITSSSTGVTYHLPTAEYNYVGNATRSSILTKAKRAAATTGRDAEFLITEASGRTFDGLTEV